MNSLELLGIHLPRILGVIGDIAWDVAYLCAIYRGFKDRTYAVPFVAICLNFAWETLFTFVFPPLTSTGTVDIVKAGLYGIWFVFDVVIVYQLFKFGKPQQSFAPFRRYFIPVVLASFVAAFVGEYTLFDALGRQHQDEMAYGMNLLMSCLFLTMLRDRPDLRGISRGTAWFKMIGTGLISWTYVLPNWAGLTPLPPFYVFLYIAIFVIDVVYVVLVEQAYAAQHAQTQVIPSLKPQLA